MEKAAEQPKNRSAEHLKEHRFKPGQSGNPKGRPAGPSLKEWARIYLAKMTDQERLDYIAGMPKEVVWKMAEGNPKQDTELHGNLTISDVLDELENGRPKTEGQELEG